MPCLSSRQIAAEACVGLHLVYAPCVKTALSEALHAILEQDEANYHQHRATENAA
jgi:hypothetical protein